MLNELINYAKANKLSDVPGFKSKTAKWLIIIDEQGKLIDIIDAKRKYSMCPNLEQFEMVSGRGETKCHFLLDTLSVVTLYKSQGKDIDKHRYYKKMLTLAKTHEPLLSSILALLSDKDELAKVNDKLNANRAKKTDTVSFMVNNTDIIETNTWHNWWIDYRKSIIPDKGPQTPMICIASGELTEPTTNHYKISGLTGVGGLSSGTALISFDKSSFTSYNLPQSLNASCSPNTVAAYRNALDDLIEKAPRPLGNSMFLYWYKEPIPDEDDIFELGEFNDNDDVMQETAANKVERIFNSIIEGKRPELTNNIYYILQITGASGRVMVRDWLTGDFSELVGNFKSWFDDLMIVDPYGNSISNDFKLSAALHTLVSYRKNEHRSKRNDRIKKELTPNVPLIWRSIIENRELPDTIASRALSYINSKLLSSENKEENLDRISCALLKAYIIRKFRERGDEIVMKPELDPGINSAEYQSGRLLAVLAMIQQTALGAVNAGMVQRYYTSASTTPMLVIGKLIQLSQHHLNKIGKSNKGLSVWYEKILEEIMSQIRLEDIPKVLSLSGQTLFSLGYYQQRAHMSKRNVESTEGGENNDNQESL